jgi:protein associated with RNAse G/E
MHPEVNSQVYIQAYKHDGSLHRTWSMGDVLEADEKHFVIVTNKSWVLEHSGYRWNTREPAIGYYFTERWFNVIAMIRDESIYFYVNLASPALWDEEAVKFIDYDIDYKIYEQDLIITMDQDEYFRHKKSMHYPDEIDEIIHKTMDEILDDVRNQRPPFNRQYVEEHFQQYLKQLAG